MNHSRKFKYCLFSHFILISICLPSTSRVLQLGVREGGREDHNLSFLFCSIFPFSLSALAWLPDYHQPDACSGPRKESLDCFLSSSLFVGVFTSLSVRHSTTPLIDAAAVTRTAEQYIISSLRMR